MKSPNLLPCSFSTLSQIGVTLDALLSLVCPLNAFSPHFSLILVVKGTKAEFSCGTKLHLQNFLLTRAKSLWLNELQGAGDTRSAALLVAFFGLQIIFASPN